MFRLCGHLLPGGLVLIIAAWMITRTTAVPASTWEWPKFTPYLVFGTGLILSAVFHRSRNFHSLLLLGTSAITVALGHRYLSSMTLELLLKAVALLLPLNLILISFLPETGIFTRSAAIRVGVLISQAVAVAVACRFFVLQTLALINARIIQAVPFEDFRGLPQSVLIANAVAFVLLLAQIVRRRFRPTDIGIYWALL